MEHASPADALSAGIEVYADGTAAVEIGGKLVQASGILASMLTEVSRALNVDTADVSLSILERILQARTLAETSPMTDTLGTRDVIGRRLVVRGYRWMPSEIGEGAPFYMLLDCADASTGEALTLNTSSLNVMGQVFTWVRNGWAPVTCTVEAAKKATRAGFRPLWLVPELPA